jgi:hydroxymethylpyrimidine/phosphomethylpyrimidine kinase
MLHRTDIVEMLAKLLPPYIPLVLDPVMFAKGGAPLLKPEALTALKEKLIPHAHIITPNVPEAEFLSGMKILSINDMKWAAEKILALGCKSVLIKGGHLEGEDVTDLLVDKNGSQSFGSKRIDTIHTHGTGCTLASAIATGIAQKLPLEEAVARGRMFVRKAIKEAPKLGKGHGPLGHARTFKAFN